MRLTISNGIEKYDVVIKVTDENGNKATKRALCALNCMLAKARQKYHEEGHTSLARGASEVEDSIYNALDERGYYDDVKRCNNEQNDD